jgi:hypothetical protein
VKPTGWEPSHQYLSVDHLLSTMTTSPLTAGLVTETETPPLPESVTVTLWIRTNATDADEQQTRLRERVAALADAGVETTVHECPDHVTDPGTMVETAALQAFDRYRAVAGHLGARVDPFFRCWTNPDGSRTVVFPPACLAVEREGTLTGLYPCEVDGERFTVADALDAIETGDVENLR